MAKNIHCDICDEDYDKDTCAIKKCKCVFCSICLKSYLKTQIEIGADEINCPSNCPKWGKFSFEEIRKIAGQELLKNI